MEKFAIILKRGLLLIIFATLFLPLIQYQFKIIEIGPLFGDISIPQKSHFTNKEWFSGDYQQNEEEFQNSSFGFRELFVRLHNQLKFSFFHAPTANGVIIGKENYLYEENYIKAYTGIDFLGEDSIHKITNRIKFISDTLTKLNKQLLIVFAAGKASFYPEYIPDVYFPIKGKTNYKVFSDEIKNSGINNIDFNNWFIEQKDKSKYPLYPKYGIHWSNYGTVLAADSILKQIEYLRKIDVPNLIYNDIKMKPPEGIDYDVADGMNLLFRFKSFDMAYPTIKTESSENKIKPSVLVISDSFYWGMYDFGIANSFSNDHFWYYNKQVYPETFKSELFVEDLALKEEIEKHDVIVVIATEATLPKIGWGFFEQAEKYFRGVKNSQISGFRIQKQIRDFKIAISGDKKWMEQIQQKAKERGISADSMLTLDALWIIENKN